MSGGYLEGVWRVSGYCLKSGGCLEGVWRVSVGCSNDMWGGKSGKGNSGLVKVRQMKSGQVKSG